MTTLDKITLPMPRLGETMDEGTIANWIVKPGEDFARGDALLELETDKTLVEYPALGNGKLLETLVGPGDIVVVGAPIAVIETNDVWEGIGETKEDEKQTPTAEISTIGTIPADAGNSGSSRLRATPLARRLARQNNIDLNAISGTGRRNRIEARDVQAALGSVGGTGIELGRARQISVVTDNFLLVHGLGGAGSNWTALRGHLERHGMKTKAPDLPAHGRNSIDAPTVEHLIDWLVGELNQQPEPVHLVGHSLGAHVCALAARLAPEKVSGLTLISPAGCGIDINGAFIDGVANAATAGEVAHLMRMLGPKAASLGNDALQSMASEISQGRLRPLAALIARGDRQLIDTLTALGDVASAIPTRAIFGAGDTIVPKEHIFNMPPHVASHIVRSGHMPHWDCPGLLQRLLTENG